MFKWRIIYDVLYKCPRLSLFFFYNIALNYYIGTRVMRTMCTIYNRVIQRRSREIIL